MRRQSHSHNVEASTPEDYYRIAYYNEFLSHVISQIQEQFSTDSTHILQLLPSQCCDNNVHTTTDINRELCQAVEFYKADLPHVVMFPTEYRMLVARWKLESQSSEVPCMLTDALKACDATTFPNISILLQLALTLPVTSRECERSFSQLKLVKTALRLTKTGDRLSGLVLMKISRSSCEKLHTSPRAMHELVSSFAQLHPRTMTMLCVLTD